MTHLPHTLPPANQNPQVTKPSGQRLLPNTILRDRPKGPSPRFHTRGLPETRADKAAQETRNGIAKLSAVVKAVVPKLGEQIAILTTHRLGPQETNPPTSSRPPRVVVPHQSSSGSSFATCTLEFNFTSTASKEKGRK